MTDVDRAAAMAASVAKAARRVGVAPEGVEWLSQAHALAMKPRIEQLDDDHHPAYLHPGRSALVLMRDADVDDAKTLVAAAVLESRDSALALRSGEILSLGADLADMLATIPAPGDERLAERLVTISEGARLAALAERLDHLRHEHLRDERDHWADMHDEVGAVWLPVAERTHSKLARRFAHWHRTFARRLG